MSKYKILVIPSDTTGCGKFRSVDPHLMLQQKYNDLFQVDIKYSQEVWEHKDKFPQFLENYDLIHIHKEMDPKGLFIQMCKFLGKKVIVDVDDHYDLGIHHPMSITAKKEHWADRVLVHLKYADYVTTTQDRFAQTLLKHNKNVFVLPNAINPLEPQFQPIENPSDKLRIGIICGSTHLVDLQLLNGMVSQFSKDELEKLQFVLCGFDTRGWVTFYEDGQKKKRPIQPLETCWYRYEQILTNNYQTISENYKHFLHMFTPNMDYPLVKNEPYRRCWTKNINEYATHYNNIDVLLVPLVESDFNAAKSNLKVIEAGFMHKALIASNVGPYTIDLKNAVNKGTIDLNGNALLVDKTKNFKTWSKYIRLLLNNKELLSQLQENLYNTVKDKYNLETVTEKRKNFYLEILEK